MTERKRLKQNGESFYPVTHIDAIDSLDKLWVVPHQVLLEGDDGNIYQICIRNDNNTPVLYAKLYKGES